MSKLTVHSLANVKDSLKLVNYFAQKIIRGEISHCNHVFDYLRNAKYSVVFIKRNGSLNYFEVFAPPCTCFFYVPNIRIGLFLNSFPTSPLLRNKCKILFSTQEKMEFSPFPSKMLFRYF